MSNQKKVWFVKIKPKTSSEQILKQIITAMEKAGWKINNKKCEDKNKDGEYPH